MKALLVVVAALALGALSSDARAEPVTLTDSEMDRVTAAGFVSIGVQPSAVTGFERTLIPPLARGLDRFGAPAGTIFVVRDGDGFALLDPSTGIRFATPGLRTFARTPFALIIVNQAVFGSPTVP